MSEAKIITEEGAVKAFFRDAWDAHVLALLALLAAVGATYLSHSAGYPLLFAVGMMLIGVVVGGYTCTIVLSCVVIHSLKHQTGDSP